LVAQLVFALAKEGMRRRKSIKRARDTALGKQGHLNVRESAVLCGLDHA